MQWREVLLREIGITAERAQAYKPSRQIFEHGYRTMGVTKDETVHVATGMFLDIKACHDFGIRGIWINRRGEAGKSRLAALQGTAGPHRGTRPPDAGLTPPDAVPVIFHGSADQDSRPQARAW